MSAKWFSSCYRWHKQWALHFRGDGTVNLKFSDLPFSPVICYLFHRLARQLPVIAKIHCFRVSEQNSLKLPRWWNTQPLPPSSSHSFPITPPWDSFSSSLLFMFFSAYFLWTLLFFSPPSSITLCFKAIWILLSNSVLFVLKPPLLQPSFFCHLSPPHKSCFCCICQLWLHFITLFNYLTSISYCSAN